MRIGSHLSNTGCNFNVWAPHADSVSVVLQSGQQWSPTASSREQALTSVAGNYFEGTVAGVRAGDLYRYRIKSGTKTFERLDPAARDVVHSGLVNDNGDSDNASIVVDPTFAWKPFGTPRFENWIIYQLHIGTFCGRNDHLNLKVDEEFASYDQVRERLPYIKEMGYSAVQFLPVHEFQANRSWGYNPASFFAPESAYGTPAALRALVDAAHGMGLAVIFDVVYNHGGPGDNVLWKYDGYGSDNPEAGNHGGIYFEGGQWTDWGRGPAWYKSDVQNFFYENARMFLDDYNADGLRFDVTTQIDGNELAKLLARLQAEYPSKYFIAEHLPADRWITTFGNFDATWQAKSHHEMQRALVGQQPVEKVESLLGWMGFDHPWNLVKYPLGSHDDVGDDKNGNAKDGLSNWDNRHRYLIDQLGGRDDFAARAKCRLAWALAATMPGTPMMFMGGECHMGSPTVGWGYFHDGSDQNGDHRFDWAIAGDPTGMPMRRLVAAANALRWTHPALRSETLDVTHRDLENGVIAFKRWSGGDVLLTIVHLGEKNFLSREYGVLTGGQDGQWTQVLCTQDPSFGGWEGAGNAFHEPWTQGGRIFINLPQYSVVVMSLK